MTTSVVAARPLASMEPVPTLPARRCTASRVIRAETPASMPLVDSPVAMCRRRTTFAAAPTREAAVAGTASAAETTSAATTGSADPWPGARVWARVNPVARLPWASVVRRPTSVAAPRPAPFASTPSRPATIAAAGTRVNAPLAPSAVAHESVPTEFANSSAAARAWAAVAPPACGAGTRIVRQGHGAAMRAAASACRAKAPARTMSATPAQAVIRAYASRTATASHDRRCDGGVRAIAESASRLPLRRLAQLLPPAGGAAVRATSIAAACATSVGVRFARTCVRTSGAAPSASRMVTVSA